jgi:hypothetical protein
LPRFFWRENFQKFCRVFFWRENFAAFLEKQKVAFVSQLFIAFVKLKQQQQQQRNFFVSLAKLKKTSNELLAIVRLRNVSVRYR